MQNQQTGHIFQSLGPVNGKLSGQSVYAYLLTSNLPTHLLREIWTRSDADKDGCLTLEEFSTALGLIQNFKRGLNAAAVSSMNAVPVMPSQQWTRPPGTVNPQLLTAASNWSSFSADQGRNTSPMKPGSSTLGFSVPASITSEAWVVDLKSKTRYLAMFNRLDNRRTGSVHGTVVRGEILNSGLSALTLSQIWTLSDISKTGSLSADEFCLAMYLVESAQRGKDPPPALTPALVPPQYRHFLFKDNNSSTSPAESIFTKPSFENRKLENFNKGEAELERRRLELIQKEKKEAEDKEAVVAAAQELERQKAALQARRQLEFQRQRTKSLEVAAQQKHQQEQEQQTLYRSKMESWAISRKQQLEGQLGRLRELTTGIRTRNMLLSKELSDLVSRKDRIDSTRTLLVEEKTKIYLELEKLEGHKKDIVNEVSSARMAVQSSQTEIANITNDKLRLIQQIRAMRDPDEIMVSLLEEQERAKQSVISLKSTHLDILTKSEQCQAELYKLEMSQTDMDGRFEERQRELESKERLLNELKKLKEEAEAEERAKKEAAELLKAQENSVREEKLMKIEASLKQKEPVDQQIEEFERARLQSIKFSELLSHQSEEANSDLQEIVAAKQLARAALNEQRERLARLVAQERIRHNSEQEEFKEKVASLPRHRDKVGSLPRHREKVASLPRHRDLICLDTPPRPSQGRADFIKDLSEVLATCPTALPAKSAKRVAPVISAPLPVISAPMPVISAPILQSAPQQEHPIYQYPSELVKKEEKREEVEWEEDDYQECIYMNVDPEGILSKARSPGPPQPTTSDPRSPTRFSVTSQDLGVTSQDLRVTSQDLLSPTTFGVVSGAGEQPAQKDPIYAEAVAHQPTETLFEVETLVDYIGTTIEELSFSKGARISVYEVRGEQYYGELDSRTGVVSVSHVEKCEWIYGDMSVNKEVVALYDYQSEVEGDLSFVTGEIITVNEDLGEWYRGVIGTRTGIFPGNFVEDVEAEDLVPPPPSALPPNLDMKPICTGAMLESYLTEDIELQAGDAVEVLAQPDSYNVFIQNSTGRRAWVKTELLKLSQEELPSNGPIGAERIPASLHCYSLYPYTAQNNDELTLKRDDIITITEQSDPHWWIGRHCNDVGVLPANYVEQINDQITWDTVKSWNANLSAAEDERTRQEAIHELISTEKTYIDDLLLVVEVFYNPLCAVATDDELNSVFVNWQQLILCNARLFRALYNNSDINSFESVGSVFLEEIDSLVGPYTKFCSAQRQAMASLQDNVSAVFKAKEQECAGSPKVGKLPLSTFLLKPMQRITKYPLLIKKILQHTRDTHPDYDNLKNSLARTEYLLTSVNEAVRATTRLESLQRVFDKSCCDLGEKVKLNSSTNCLGPRKLVHFGTVSKTKGSKELLAILFNDMLLVSRVDKGRYGNKPVDIDSRDFDLIKFEPYRDPFLLNNVFPVENNSRNEQCFCFGYNDKTYSFYCQSQRDAVQWADYLNDALRNAHLLYHSDNKKGNPPDPTFAGQATITLRIVEGLELCLPHDERPTSIFVQGSLHGYQQRTPSSNPKWDHTMHFVVQDVNSDKINVSVYKEYQFSPNMSLGKFDLSIQKLIRSGGPGPWNKRLILTDTNSGMINVCIMLRYNNR